MEGPTTRIPKPRSGLKPPTSKFTTNSRVLTSVPENKTAAPHPSTSAKIPPLPKMPTIVKMPPNSNHLLRRRSKSVTDLRSVQSKPLVPSSKSTKLTEKNAMAKKRPLAVKNDDEVKAKVPKVKIPDWDYKSRFQELQRKYSLLQEDFKESKSKLSEFKDLEQELSNLRQDNDKKQKQLQVLETKQKNLTIENQTFRNENVKLTTELNNTQVAFEKLKEQHERLVKTNEGMIRDFESLQQIHTQTSEELKCIKYTCGQFKSQIEDLKHELEEQENLRRNLHNVIQDLKGNIRVFCRVRPPTSEENDKQLCSIMFPDESSLEIRKSRESVSVNGRPMDFKQEFSFDKVFPPEAEQGEVFEELSQLVQSALDGYHVCVFAYGQTGSGKTYTMLGSPLNHGMIPRTVDLIFQKIRKLENSNWTYKVTASVLEIYNENIRDLLEPNSTHNYELRYNEGRGVTVTNLKVKPVNSSEELKQLMEEAHKNRAVASTDFNEHSSRSHAVTKINLVGQSSGSNVQYNSSINLVDLAGSESAKTSSAERLTETKSINKSLSTLGNVMLALHNKDPHIPYRNSKLTFLLQSCLGGNSKTLMFVNISPFEECYGESINSLRFAAKVKDVKTSAKKNKCYTAGPPVL